MVKKDINKYYLNKLFKLEIIGKGNAGDFFGKIDNIVCFITETKDKKIKYGETINIRIINTTNKCLFAELIDTEKLIDSENEQPK